VHSTWIPLSGERLWGCPLNYLWRRDIKAIQSHTRSLSLGCSFVLTTAYIVWCWIDYKAFWKQSLPTLSLLSVSSSVMKPPFSDRLVSTSTVCSTGCSKSHATHGLRGICVSWTPHFKKTVASTIPGLKPPRLLFMGASQGYCVLKSYTHTLQEIQANIQRTVERISTGTLQNVFANMIRRVNLCEERNGGHFRTYYKK
jgi:hypothetical protein